MITGLPGNMARLLAGRAEADPRFRLVPFSLTGPEIEADRFREDGLDIALLHPDRREAAIADVTAGFAPMIAVDFTHPSAVNANAAFYVRHGIPFVMGTTGGDRARLEATVTASGIAAVIAPNMAKQIVGFQAMMAFGAERFPGLFQGYRLAVRESHQKGKADTSGTAKAMVGYFNAMGIDFSPDAIRMERDPEAQRRDWGVPEPYLGGHGWHTYTLDSPDGTVRFEFTHNVNGRDIYVGGTFDAVAFLAARIAEGAAGKVYSMMDVLSDADG
jgi:4-hydroxy-tetrahydrodipicolinate reductase